MSAPAKDFSHRPFSSVLRDSDVAFWREYCVARPSPTDDFFEKIMAYHSSHGATTCEVAHDVGTGPGNIAWRLAEYFKQVVGSDINDSALKAGSVLIPEKHRYAVSLVNASAEDLGGASGLPPGTGVGENDLVLVSECMPLLDAEKSVKSFEALLKPGGTLAIYFYGRAIFTNGARAKECDKIYDQIASRINRFYHPLVGSAREPFFRRSADTLSSYLDNVEIPSASWEYVERHKWNTDRPLIFNGRDGYDFDWNPVDRRNPGEKNVELVNRELWKQDWDLSQVKAYLACVYPMHHERAGDSYAELEPLYEQLEKAMGGPGARSTISFPLVLILATKKQYLNK